MFGPLVVLGALDFEFGLNVFTIFIVNDDFGVCESRVVRNEFRFWELFGLIVAHNIYIDLFKN